MAEQSVAEKSVTEQARDAVLQAIVKTASKIENSPAGVRDLAEAYALLEGTLAPNVGGVHTKS